MIIGPLGYYTKPEALNQFVGITLVLVSKARCSSDAPATHELDTPLI